MDNLIAAVVDKNQEAVGTIREMLEQEPDLTVTQIRVKLAQELGFDWLNRWRYLLFVLVAAAKLEKGESDGL